MDDLGVPLFLDTPICFIVKHHTLCHFFGGAFGFDPKFSQRFLLENHVAKMSSPTPRPFGGCLSFLAPAKCF